MKVCNKIDLHLKLYNTCTKLAEADFTRNNIGLWVNLWQYPFQLQLQNSISGYQVWFKYTIK